MRVKCQGELLLFGKPIRYYKADTGYHDIGICFCASELCDFFGYASLSNGANQTATILKGVTEARRFKASALLPGRPRARTCWFVSLSGIIEIVFRRNTDYREVLLQSIMQDPSVLAPLIGAIIKEKPNE